MSNIYEGYDVGYIRDRLEWMTYDQLRELDPGVYGFDSIAEMLLYIVHQDRVNDDAGPRYIRAIARRADERVDRILDNMPRHKAAYERRITQGPNLEEARLESEVEEIVDRETIGVIHELTDYWRQRGKL